jgi:hypothetical protein
VGEVNVMSDSSGEIRQAGDQVESGADVDRVGDLLLGEARLPQRHHVRGLEGEVTTAAVSS